MLTRGTVVGAASTEAGATETGTGAATETGAVGTETGVVKVTETGAAEPEAEKNRFRIGNRRRRVSHNAVR